MSASPNPSAHSACHSLVGGELRAARERLGWALSDIGRTLKIRPGYLAALEESRVQDLPAPVYGVGFVRAYATLLGLPCETMCRRYKDEIGHERLAPELVFPTPIAGGGVPFGAAALIAVAVAVAGYVAWYKLSANRPAEVASVPPVPERLAPLAEPAPQATLAAPSSPIVGRQVTAAAPATNAQPAAPAADNAAVSPSQAAATGVANPPNYEQAAGSPATSRVMLRANADAWVQVHDGSGNLLFSRILHAGESWQVPGDARALFLTTGNAGGTEVIVDGKPTASLGGLGMVRRDLPLDPDQVKAGKLAVPVAATAPPPVPGSSG